MADEFNLSDFIVIGFSRRIEFIIKAKSLNTLRFCAVLSYFRCPGPSGNHPFSTRFFWWINSKMLQNEEKAVTPSIVDAIRFSTMIDSAQNTMPATRNIHQHFVPR